MTFNLSNGFYINEYTIDDIASLVSGLRDGSVYEWTLQIPYPYTSTDAERWLSILQERKRSDGHVLNWAIRDAYGKAIGGIGFHPSANGQEHAVEIGYWLAKSHWNQGIMTSAVSVISDYAFNHLGIFRITAAIFAGNRGSAKVLEKNGFEIEAPLMCKCYQKDNRFIDAILYARIKPLSI